MSYESNTDAVATLAFVTVGRLIEALANKGLITDAEGVEIYRNAVGSMSENLREEGRNILKAMIPDIKV